MSRPASHPHNARARTTSDRSRGPFWRPEIRRPAARGPPATSGRCARGTARRAGEAVGCGGGRGASPSARRRGPQDIRPAAARGLVASRAAQLRTGCRTGRAGAPQHAGPLAGTRYELPPAPEAGTAYGRRANQGRLPGLAGPGRSTGAGAALGRGHRDRPWRRGRVRDEHGADCVADVIGRPDLPQTRRPLSDDAAIGVPPHRSPYSRHVVRPAQRDHALGPARTAPPWAGSPYR